MASTMTTAQRAHTNKVLAELEQLLSAVLNYGVSSSERAQLATELTEIRSQRQALDEAHPNEAYQWTKAATARTKKLRLKHSQSHTTSQRRLRTRRSNMSPHSTPPVPAATPAHSPTDTRGQRGTPPLVLPYTDDHRQLIKTTAGLLLSRRSQLQRSARVTTGSLRIAIVKELHRVDDDLHSLGKMSYKKATACRDYHQHAEDLWNEHGAEGLVRRPSFQ